MSLERLKSGDGGLKVPVSLMEAPAAVEPSAYMLPETAARRAGNGRPGSGRPGPGRNRSSWSCAERGLVIGLVLAILVIFTLLVVIFVAPPMADSPVLYRGKVSFCAEASCVQVAGEVLSKADLTADPCTDFYRYACGGWLDNLVVPPDRPRFGVASQLVEHNQLRLKKLLEAHESLLYGEYSASVQKAKDFYAACIIGEDLHGGSQNISRVINEFGSWTLTGRGPWTGAGWSLERALLGANHYQVWPLFDRDVRQDLYNSRQMVITFSPPDLTAPAPHFYFGRPAAKFRAAFRQLFTQVARALGAENETAHNVADSMWHFERRLAEILKERDHDSRQELYRKVTLQQLQNTTGSWINIRSYLSMVHEVDIPSDEPLVVVDLDYMKQLGVVVSETPKSTLANYITWCVIKSLIPHAGVDFRSARLRFKQKMEGVSDLGANWAACIETTTQVLGQATGAIFAEKFLSEFGKERAVEMLALLKSAFLANLPDLDWMAATTRQKAAAKLDAMVDMVGYGSVASSAYAIDEYYSEMRITKNNALENWIQAVHFHFRRTRDKRGKPRDRTDWGYTSPTTVNAFYQQQDNAMMFPAGILRPPFFDSSYPMAMNFGAIGTVMAHELTHGFDDQGRRYDKWGSLRNWWDNTSRKAFAERAKCFVKQYSQYKVAGTKVNGHLTLSENLADSGAVRTAYTAYNRWRMASGDDSGGEAGARLTGINTTEAQTFFLAYAQLFCTYYTPEFATRLLYTDTHTPAKYRVIGALSNFDKFSEAFACPPNTPMNPADKCRLW